MAFHFRGHGQTNYDALMDYELAKEAAEADMDNAVLQTVLKNAKARYSATLRSRKAKAATFYSKQFCKPGDARKRELHGRGDEAHLFGAFSVHFDEQVQGQKQLELYNDLTARNKPCDIALRLRALLSVPLDLVVQSNLADEELGKKRTMPLRDSRGRFKRRRTCSFK
jgi:hypothetical protein